MTAIGMRRVVGAVAALIAGALVLSGCFLAPSPAPTRPPVTTGADAELLEFYDQTVVWESCSDGAFDCATIRVPRDYADPAAASLDIAIIRHRADDAEPLGSLLVNPGGPGASGIEIVRDSLGIAVGPSLRQAYDVIGFDPRGVGDSTAVNCYDGADLDAYLYDVPEYPRGTPEWEAELEESNAAFAAACDANSGGILPFITTENAARDMDVLRAVLGDAALNYLGYSYGAYLGAIYADLFPDRVGRMVLDGAIDPALSGGDVAIGQSVGFENSLRAFFEDCAQRDDCPYGGTPENMRADLEALLDRVGTRPVAAPDGRELGTDSLMTAIVAALYSPTSWGYLRLAIAGVENGDPAMAFTLADLYWGRQQGEYVDNSTEAFIAYNCMDYPGGANPEDEAQEERLRTEAPLSYEYRFGPDVCDLWPYEPPGTREPVTAEGAPPILVVGTTGDPATPYDWSVSLAQQISGVLITRVGEGHLGYNQGNACVDDAVEGYFVDGIVPDADVRCG